jgi:hypothetical protein
MLKKQGLEKGSGKSATASIKKTIVPVVEDWKKTYAYIHKNKAFELLHRRLASTAWSEVIEAGGKVPGVAALEVEDLSLTKS